eukprot:UN28028
MGKSIQILIRRWRFCSFLNGTEVTGFADDAVEEALEKCNENVDVARINFDLKFLYKVKVLWNERQTRNEHIFDCYYDHTVRHILYKWAQEAKIRKQDVTNPHVVSSVTFGP